MFRDWIFISNGYVIGIFILSHGSYIYVFIQFHGSGSKMTELVDVGREGDKVIIDCKGDEDLAEGVKQNIEKGFKQKFFLRLMKRGR